MKVLILTILICCFTLGCSSSLSNSALKVQSADESMIMGCVFLGDVHGSSGWGGLASSQGMQNSKNEALEKASDLGATHIVWSNISGGYSPSAFGKAYKCK